MLSATRAVVAGGVSVKQMTQKYTAVPSRSGYVAELGKMSGTGTSCERIRIG